MKVEELKKIAEKISRGALEIDSARADLRKVEPVKYDELSLLNFDESSKEDLTNSITEILVQLTVLVDDFYQVVEQEETRIGTITDGINESVN